MSFTEVIEILVNRNEKYEDILWQIIEVDERFSDSRFGWEFSDVTELSGGMINTLLKEKIIKYDYKSNNAKHFRLTVDPVELREALESLHVEETEPGEEIIILDEEQINRWKTLVDDGTDMINYWASRINPKIDGMEYEKTAILLMLASQGDKFGDRGRIHILMHGDPGTAKSELRDWIISQIGAVSCGQRTSEVGLTGDARGGEITPGALAQADKGINCIDELDKFNNKDRQSLLTAMEEGFVEIRAGGKQVRFDARCKVFACANKIEPFSPELIDRFDFKIECKLPTAERTKHIMTSIVQSWFKEKDGYYGIELKAFLYWIQEYEPDITQDARNAIAKLMSMFVDLEGVENQSIRRRESILRVMVTIAKLHRRPVEVNDFIRAIKILHPNFNGGKMEALRSVADGFAEKEVER